MAKIKILFLCTGNSCRSQMAEGWAKFLNRSILDSYSAGISLKELNKNAVRVMTEVGVDISNQRPKYIDDFKNIPLDLIVTLCGHAKETCPIFPNQTKIIHVGFEDPPKLAKFAKTEEEVLKHYRKVRDEIRVFIENLPEKLLKLDKSYRKRLE